MTSGPKGLRVLLIARHTVTDGKITYSRFIFDRAPFDAARQTAT